MKPLGGVAWMGFVVFSDAIVVTANASSKAPQDFNALFCEKQGNIAALDGVAAFLVVSS